MNIDHTSWLDFVISVDARIFFMLLPCLMYFTLEVNEFSSMGHVQYGLIVVSPWNIISACNPRGERSYVLNPRRHKISALESPYVEDYLKGAKQNID